MPADNSIPFDRDAEPFVEVDPTGRFGRYDDLLGCGAVKKVYRAFDQEEGIEVAWNQVRLRKFSGDPVFINRLRSEVQLLSTLSNDYIIVCYSVWNDDEHNTLNFITEVCTSGNLRDYRKKHRHVSTKALKKWSKQVLEGLDYLHNHEPCIIHRDLNCSNIFVNGNIGQVKIGDLGFAAIVGKSHAAHSIIGTPEYMAPELYEEDYTEMVDIYSFAMCLLEMVTMEIPYSECDSIAKIYKKVTTGIKPQALNKVTNDEVRAFIEKCIAQPRARPTTSELLKDPFFDEDVLGRLYNFLSIGIELAAHQHVDISPGEKDENAISRCPYHRASSQILALPDLAFWVFDNRFVEFSVEQLIDDGSSVPKLIFTISVLSGYTFPGLPLDSNKEKGNAN
ncbi:putative serine/threonine-protein kinase WNK11, partial [Cucurbita argyrosperma subsp. sororia]